MGEDEPPAAPEPAMPAEPQTSVHDQTVPPVSEDGVDEETSLDPPDDSQE
ncbi:MAG: hypothetical protein M3327_15820 [Actinomycetota bacterium]|nr:hypothetical protein [Actinomycetota bacterium]